MLPPQPLQLMAAALLEPAKAAELSLYPPPSPCRLSVDGGWGEKVRIHILSGAEAPGQYSSLLARSTFCLVAPGEGRRD